MSILSLLGLPLYYLIGCFPSGYIISRRHGVNIAQHGSGNVGATNVTRVVGKGAGVQTLLLDVAKGFVPLWIAMLCDTPSFSIACFGVALVLGHCISIPGKLRGGKGVATALGVLFFMQSRTALLSLVIFTLTLQLGRRVSLASLTAVLSSPPIAFLLGTDEYYVNALGVIALLITFRHKDNLKRLIEGNEPLYKTREEKI